MQIKLGEKLRELRIQNERTQEDVATALGITSQAVSRWENDICYPDMELIPSIANYFKITIDELFGYHNEREVRIDALVKKITDMNRENNGVDICMDECVRLAREGLIEFPSNEKLMYCLASVLYNAGYVRYGEHHYTDENGFDHFDTEKHKTYAEWQEAIKIYEKLLSVMQAGEQRNLAMQELIQLYVNTGENEKAIRIANTASDLGRCKEFLLLNTYTGEDRICAFENTLLKVVECCSLQMISCVMINYNLSPAESVQIIKNAIKLFELVAPDGNFGVYHAFVAHEYLYLSEHEWLNGNHDGAFEALYKALHHAKRYDELNESDEIHYSAPLLQNITHRTNKSKITPLLAEDWPWWMSHSPSRVKAEMQADPRWEEWIILISV